MVEITAALVKELRDATNVSMMECKRALVETGGDKEKATKLLRERGVAVAAKRAAKATDCGLLAASATEDGKAAALVEVNCETDFVAKNDKFAAFVGSLAEKACGTDDPLADQVQDEVSDIVASIGEKIVVRRNLRYVLDGTGKLATYIHLGGKVGVLIEVGCENPETLENASFNELVKDLTLHVAACEPRCLVPDEVPADEVASEREIYAKQVQGKPENIIDRIVDGKMKKYFAEVCLLEQGFVKEPKQSISALLAEKGKELGDTVTIRRFTRYQMGA